MNEHNKKQVEKMLGDLVSLHPAIDPDEVRKALVELMTHGEAFFKAQQTLNGIVLRAATGVRLQ